jgi:putative mycofactocin binding protein MftB
VSPASIDLETAWTVDPRVALRPEPFGALAYHFGTRRLSFLKSRTLLDVVRGLGEHPSAREACLAAGVDSDELPRYATALAALAEGGMIRAREGA